jgi:hypothetical protein
MSLERFRQNVNIIEPYINSQSQVRILGGEPTLHPQIFEILDVFAQVIRPKMRFAIYICTNEVGEKVVDTLNQIRARYTTYTTYNGPEPNPQKRLSSSKQFCIVSKNNPVSGFHTFEEHKSIYKAAQDYLPNKEDYSKNCRVLSECGYGINPYGIFICSPAQYIATIYKLKGGLDHFPSLEEESEQKKLYCRYCYVPYESQHISPSYEKALKNWDEQPYLLPII